VLEARLTIVAGDERFELGEGGAAVVPMGVPHTFRVDSETARVLVLSTPAGLERMIRDVAVPASAATLPPADAPRPEPAELQRLFEAHGQVNLGPPLAPGISRTRGGASLRQAAHPGRAPARPRPCSRAQRTRSPTPA
jgi:hypothetical protein